MKEERDFNFRNQGLGIRDSACKVCTRKSLRDHYSRNREYYLAKVCKRNKAVRVLNKVFIRDYLRSHPCVDCGESDPIVLEFDHFKNKINAVAIMARSSTLKSLSLEVDKCVVRCANCHRKKTARQFNWTK